MSKTSGFLVTFSSQKDFANALKLLKGRGFQKLDTATPHEVEGLEHLLGRTERAGLYSMTGFAGAMTGLFGGFFMQWYASAEQTPLDIGGRPLNSWPSFIPVTYILMILGAAIFLLVTFILDLRLPWPSHPLFRTSLDLSADRFSIIVSSEDPQFDPAQTLSLLQTLKADHVEAIP